MFKNYKELFHAYVDFYMTSLYDGPATIQTKTTRTMVPLRAGPLDESGKQGHCITRFAAAAAAAVASSSSSSLRAIHLQQNNSAVQQARPTGGSNSAHGRSDYLMELTGTPCGAVAGHVVRAGGMGHDSVLLDDPRLQLEADGTRLVRIGSFNSLEVADLLHIAAVFVLLVLAKRLLSRELNDFKLIDKLGLRRKDRERLDESIWRLLYYSFSSTWLIYSCLNHGSHLLLTNKGSPPEYSFHMHRSTCAIFLIEVAFYLHATYALLFEDVWRRDSPMMLVHHLAAVFTTLSIYATRTHQIGLASTVLRDTCDVLLEVTKLTKCFHIQHGKRIRRMGIAVNCFLSVFALVFALNQLYYYPLFCLYHGLNMIKIYNIQTPVMVGILTCGLLFLLLDLLWFGLILRLLYYMALAKPMKDLREYDDEDDDIVESDENAATTRAKEKED